MLERAIQRALAQLAEIFASNYKTGKEVGQLLAGLTITAPAIYYIKKQIGGGKTKDISTQKQKDIHADSSGELNTKGQGTLVAAVYKDDDGHFYQVTKDKIYSWDATKSQWV